MARLFETLGEWTSCWPFGVRLATFMETLPPGLDQELRLLPRIGTRMSPFVPDALRPLARSVKRWPERRLHQRRRRQALSDLASAPSPASILFLCLGNICRSPFAERLMRQEFEGRGMSGILLDSAGFIGPGRPSPDRALKSARDLGVDLDPHRSKKVTAAMVKDADCWAVVMDEAHKARLVDTVGVRPALLLHLGDLDPEPIDLRTIRDPFDQEQEVFDSSYRRIRRCLDVMIRVMEEEGHGRNPDGPMGHR